MKIAFVAVNYNNCHISANYVSNVLSLRNIDKHEVEVIMVDNASQEEDYQLLKQEIHDFPKTRLVRSDTNLGYFGGLNFGIKQIDYLKFDYVVVGNNDLFFNRDFLITLERKTYGHKQTVIVPDLLTVNGIHQNPQFVHVPSKKRQFGYRVYYSCYVAAILIDMLYKVARQKRTEIKKEKLNTETEIFQCTGALMILRPDFFKNCGLLDDSLFLWGEEVALAHQLVQVGDKMLYDPELSVIHMENASVGKIASYKKYKLWKKSYMIYKNYYHE